MDPLQEFLATKDKEIEQIIIDWGIPKSDSSFNDRKSKTLLWFENFKPSEFEDTFLILKKLQYKTSNTISELSKLACEEITNIFGEKLNEVLFFPLGHSSASSGSMYLYEFLKELNLPEENFKSEDFKKYLNQQVDIVFIDDIIGSGNQATRFFNKNLKDSKANCYYFSLFGYEAGVKKIKNNTGFKLVTAIKTLTNEEMAFSENSYVFRDEKERNRIKALCEAYGKELYPDYPLGYDSSEALIVFPHNTPNNTLPIIWAGTKNEKVKGTIWRPLWERKKLKAKDTLGNKVETNSININADNKLKIISKPSKLFTGRLDKLKNIDDAFNQNEIIGLTGIGGIGKTQLALKFVEHLVTKNSGEITWQEFTESTRMDNFIIASGFGAIIQSNISEIEKFGALVDKLNEHSRIVIWDNFHDNTDASFVKFISFSSGKLSNAKIIIISRTNDNIRNYKNIELIDFEESEEYAKVLIKDRHPRLKLSDDEINQICTYVKGHPLAIELSLNLCESISIKNVIGKLSSHKKGIDELSKRLFQDILALESTSNEEKEFLYNFSIFNGRVSTEDIEGIFGEDIFYILPSLKDKYLIDFESGYYETHPLIREFCYNKLINKEELHSKTADWIIKKRSNQLDILLEERIFYHLKGAEKPNLIKETILNYGRYYVRHALFEQLNEMIDYVTSKDIFHPIFNSLSGDIHQLKGELDSALQCFQKLKENKTNDELAVEGLLKYGDVLRIKGENTQALKMFQEAEVLSKENNFQKYIAWSYNNISLIKEVYGYTLESFKLKIKALEISESLQIKEDIAVLCTNIGGTYSLEENEMFDLNKALFYFKKSLTIQLEILDKKGIANNYHLIGIIYFNKKFSDYSFKKALEYFSKSLEIELEIGNKLGISNCFNGMACIYGDNNNDNDEFNLNKAFEYFNKSLEIKIEIGDKSGTSSLYFNIASSHYNINQYKECLINLFKCFVISKELKAENKIQKSINEINGIRIDLGKDNFINHANSAINELPENFKKEISLSDFLNEPKVALKKPGRNDKIKVKYLNGEIVEGKFKNLEKDINSNKCELIN